MMHSLLAMALPPSSLAPLASYRSRTTPKRARASMLFCRGKKNASSGNRTRTACLEGTHANHCTNEALKLPVFERQIA